jgi:hypothetical protein
VLDRLNFLLTNLPVDKTPVDDSKYENVAFKFAVPR